MLELAADASSALLELSHYFVLIQFAQSLINIDSASFWNVGQIASFSFYIIALCCEHLLILTTNEKGVHKKFNLRFLRTTKCLSL